MTGMFYRIENKDGNGPYVGIDYGETWVERSHETTFYPSPYGDKYVKGKLFLNRLDHRICGFRSMRQLENWFCDKELINLENMGYHIVLVEGINATIFEKQVVFDRIEENAA